MTNEAVPIDPLGNIPRYVQFRGKRARVIGYDNGKFDILDSRDQRRTVTRSQIIFLRSKKQ